MKLAANPAFKNKVCPECHRGIEIRYWDYFEKATVIRCQGCAKRIVIPDDKTRELKIDIAKGEML
jgi:DNA-directed RNA polymerase subunit RPC12/RpoP